METKHCHKCGCTQLITYFGKDRSTKDGLTTCCKTCRSHMAKVWRTKNPEKAKQAVLTWTSNNLEHVRSRARENSENRRASLAPGEGAKAQREWRQRNPEKVQKYRQVQLVKRGKEHLLELNRSHRRFNSDRYKSIDATKRASRLKRAVKWANQEKVNAFYEEASKRSETNIEKYHVDHIIPLQGKLVSGLHNEFNLQVLKARDNLVKGNTFEVSDQ